MSADNYVVVRRFGPNNYRWGMWFASSEIDEHRDEDFKYGPFNSPFEASNDAWDELGTIEYGVHFENPCLRQD